MKKSSRLTLLTVMCFGTAVTSFCVLKDTKKNKPPGIDMPTATQPQEPVKKNAPEPEQG